MTREHGELRLTLADPCEALACPHDAALTVVDKHSKPWRVCHDHVKYFAHQEPPPPRDADDRR